ncbi:MAG: hypothetical protein K2X29_13655, partial [Candidatus Obscuribacterales bacterium]|nr:hypothetical protein [Candidatus Obscuribacterales bacterium]
FYTLLGPDRKNSKTKQQQLTEPKSRLQEIRFIQNMVARFEKDSKRNDYLLVADLSLLIRKSKLTSGRALVN